MSKQYKKGVAEKWKITSRAKKVAMQDLRLRTSASPGYYLIRPKVNGTTEMIRKFPAKNMALQSRYLSVKGNLLSGPPTFSYNQGKGT